MNLPSCLKNAILIMIGMVFFIACSDKFNQVELLEFNGKFPDESATDIEITFSDSGRTTFILFAPLLNKYYGDNPYMDCPKGIEITSFDEDGEKQSVLTANYAISEEKTMRMEARKNVVIKDLRKNETIISDQVIWDKKNKRIYSDVPVKQIKADGTVNIGSGFEANDRFTKYRVHNPRGETLVEE